MFQAFLRPLVRRLAARSVSANQITGVALVGSLAVGTVLALVGSRIFLIWWALPAWMLLRMALNAVDGMLAREHGQASRLGAYFNELADVASDAALLLPLAWLPGVHPELVVAIALLASWTELAGVLGPSIGASRRHEGPMGKADRALVFGALGGWIGLFGRVPAFLTPLLLGILVLLGVTILRRMGHGVDEAGGRR